MLNRPRSYHLRVSDSSQDAKIVQTQTTVTAAATHYSSLLHSIFSTIPWSHIYLSLRVLNGFSLIASQRLLKPAVHRAWNMLRCFMGRVEESSSWPKPVCRHYVYALMCEAPYRLQRPFAAGHNIDGYWVSAIGDRFKVWWNSSFSEMRLDRQWDNRALARVPRPSAILPA